MSALEQAQERLTSAWLANQATHDEAVNASAEWARLRLLEISEQDGDDGPTGLRFSTEYCYDDEGGYFESISVALLDAEGEDIDYDDALESCGPEAIRRLCGCVEGADEGEITVAEARERSF